MAVVYGRELLEDELKNAESKFKTGLEGELRVLSCLEDIMPSDCVILAKPNIGEYEPDLLILRPDMHIILAEVKNISIGTIKAIHPNGLIECQSYQMNPTEQVKTHRDQLQQFVYAVSKKDVYRNIGHCVVFPSISRDEFKNRFKQYFNTWKNTDTNNFFKYHIFLEDLQGLSKWEGCFKFQAKEFPLNQFDVFSLVNKMKPRKRAEFCLNIKNAEAIRVLTPLQKVFAEMEISDFEETNMIRKTVQSLVQNAMVTSENAVSIMEGLLALKNLKMELILELNPYLNKMNELTQMENKLITKGKVITESFKKEVEIELKDFFDNQTVLMCRQVQGDTKWHSTLTDTTKKASGIVLKGTERLLSLNDRTKSAAKNLSNIDSRTLIEQLLERYLSSKEIQSAMEVIIKKASANYEEKWRKLIDEHSYFVNRFTPRKTGTLSNSKLSTKHTIGASEQVLGLTLSSAVIGTVGLAAGWHTLTYAALNVFPPIAFFAAFATVTTGIVTKNKVIESRKEEVKTAAESMYSHILKEFNPPRTQNKKNALFIEVDIASTLYTKGAVKQGKERLLGDLTLNHYMDLIHAFQELDLLLQSSIEHLEKQLKSKELV